MSLEPPQHGERDVATVVRWAWVRMCLGWAQMAGASASIVLLAVTGVSTPAIVVLSVTTAFTVVSVILFRVLKLPRNGGRWAS
jgi:hypothetical protein